LHQKQGLLQERSVPSYFFLTQRLLLTSNTITTSDMEILQNVSCHDRTHAST